MLLGDLQSDPGSAGRIVVNAFRASGAQPTRLIYGTPSQFTTMRAHVDDEIGTVGIGVTGVLHRRPDFRRAAEQLIGMVGRSRDLTSILILYYDGPDEDEIAVEFDPADIRFMQVRSFLQRLRSSTLHDVIELAQQSPPSYEPATGRVEAFDRLAQLGLIRPANASEPVVFTSAQLLGATPGQQVRFSYAMPTTDNVRLEAADVEAAAAEAAPQIKQVGAWITEGERVAAAPEAVLQPGSGLTIGHHYTLKLKVGDPEPASLLDDPTVVIPATDIPPEGIDTHWVVSSESLRLLSAKPVTAVTSEEGLRGSVVGFPLHIPAEGDSETISLPFIPLAAGRATIHLRAFIGRQLYRSLTAEVVIGAQPSRAAPLLTRDFEPIRADRIALTTMSSQERLGLNVLQAGSDVLVNGAGRGWALSTERMRWPADLERLAGVFEAVRSAAETLREKHDEYLNAIDPDDLREHLDAYVPVRDHGDLADSADDAHVTAWERVSDSPELRALVAKGHALYNAVFPPKTPLRQAVESLRPGALLDIDWSESGKVPDVPWTLMYAFAPDKPIDALGFLGLRYRIKYTAYPATSGPETLLGSTDDADTACCLFWGSAEADTAAEARRHHDALATAGRVFIPDRDDVPEPKALLLDVLRGDQGDHALAVLYMFCHYGHLAGEEPSFQFGDTNGESDVLSLLELEQISVRAVPLIFANACATGAQTAFEAHPFKAHFFTNGTAAYLGTETMVPISFASRFATAFLQLFDSGTTGAYLSAGEAVTQARLLLWCRYRNIGGLLYSLTNQYDLLRASSPEDV
jgi:CHAT domain